jgi:N6-L-threonylcarbamoyladenine synthase
MIGLPYPGGPEVDRCAKQGNRKAYDFPRSMLITKDHDFSFSGLKTSVLYMLDKLDRPLDDCRADLCASFQEAVMDILIGKTIRLAQQLGEKLITVSGGVSGNSRLQEAGLQLLIAPAALTTDNAAMIAYVAWQKAQRGDYSPLEEDVNPNLRLAERN